MHPAQRQAAPPLQFARHPADGEGRTVVQPVEHVGQTRAAAPRRGGQPRLPVLLQQVEVNRAGFSGGRRLTCPVATSAFRLLSRVGEGDISALGCGLTGSCSSTFQHFSLGDHLGVTASPQSPCPAGYVTLPVDGRSPPLGLMPSYSRGQGVHSVPPFSSAFQTHAPRTIRVEAHRT